MGMFDDITCERPLPGPTQPPYKSFQTKDFDCLMDHYTITGDGTLTKDGVPVPFHGMVNFYTFTPEHMWFEYNAKFTDGKLIEIQPVSIYEQGRNGGENVVFYPSPDAVGASDG